MRTSLSHSQNAEIGAFSDSSFPLHGQNRIRIFPYLDRFSNSAQIRENMDMILSIYGKIPIRESPYFDIFMHCFPVPNFYDGLTWKHNPFKDIEKFHQPTSITPLQLGIIIEISPRDRAAISWNNSGLIMIYKLKVFHEAIVNLL